MKTLAIDIGTTMVEMALVEDKLPFETPRQAFPFESPGQTISFGSPGQAFPLECPGQTIPLENPRQTIRFENPQRLYGSDVISRMKNAVRLDLAAKMQQLIGDAIYEAALSAGMDWDSLSSIVISANTPMQHLFFGWDPEGMLDAPFQPASLAPGFSHLKGVPVLSFPGISAFVGGDIVSGMYALGLLAPSRTNSVPSGHPSVINSAPTGNFHSTDSVCPEHTSVINSAPNESLTAMESRFDPSHSPTLFVDLGTNGEIALNIPGKPILATSVAAGPAFEGGNISKGMPAVSGAIDSLSIRKGFCRIHTVNDALPPKGICGSGLIEAVYELFVDGIINKHGTFVSDDFRENGFPLYQRSIHEKLLLTQKDIRSLQVAKAAICAGILSLLDYAKISESDIATLYLAGSFGTHLDIQKASGIGLIPEALVDKTILAGNASLHGAIMLARHPNDLEAIKLCASNATSLSLADSAYFQEAYIRSMDLG